MRYENCFCGVGVDARASSNLLMAGPEQSKGSNQRTFEFSKNLLAASFAPRDDVSCFQVERKNTFQPSAIIIRRSTTVEKNKTKVLAIETSKVQEHIVEFISSPSTLLNHEVLCSMHVPVGT